MMKTIKLLAILSAMVVGFTASAPTLAHHRARVHLGVGVHFGVPLYAPWYYPSPYYYYPPAVVSVPYSPPVYIERGADVQSPPAPQSQAYWYYCADSGAYYPYVKECSGGWQRVLPTPN